ncbi:hypothetical protein [Pseudoalteromonas fuliginea]|uniref:hypothetical protein n=1 Tax=Pseudoalteromonas fuliginea TaxID=1872678 RepID=UPI0031796950
MKLKLLNDLKKAVINAPLNFEFGGLLFKFTAQIKLVPESELKILTEKQGANDGDIVRELLVSWDDFIDDGKDVPFDKSTLEELLVYSGLTARLSVECVNAQYRINEKN